MVIAVKATTIYQSLITTLLFLLATGNAGLVANEIKGKSTDIKLIRTVNLRYMGKSSWISEVEFSPNGDYLAIVDNLTPFECSVIIWDIENNKEKCRINGLLRLSRQARIFWSPDGKYISDGRGLRTEKSNIPMRLWDPCTGNIVKELNITSNFARLSPNGSMLMVHAIKQPPSRVPK